MSYVDKRAFGIDNYTTKTEVEIEKEKKIT